MPTIRERFANLVLGPEKRKIEQSMALLMEGYRAGPWELTPGDLLAKLREVDSGVLLDLVTQLQWDSLGYVTTTDTGAERTRSVQESRRLYKYDVVTDWIIKLWTNFGFGNKVGVTPVDEKAADVWTAFWTSDLNQNLLGDDVLAEQSNTLLVDGEVYWVYFISQYDGSVTVTQMSTDEVTEVITHPENKRIPLFYKRYWTSLSGEVRTIYYPDWLAYISGLLDLEYTDSRGNKTTLADAVIPATERQNRADMLKEGTVVFAQQIAYNRKSDNRGWPLMMAGAAWSREHKRFRENRASVAAAVAMFVRKMKVQGGSRAIDAIRAKIASNLNSSTYLDSNPPAVAGSTLIENGAVDTSTMPLTTGAGDAKTDGDSLLQMAGLGGGVFPHWLGSGDAYRLATATAMEQPLLRNFTRYQLFWAAQFRKMCRVVLWAYEQAKNTEFETYDAEVSTDAILENDLSELATAISTMLNSMNAAPMDAQSKAEVTTAVWQVFLGALKIGDVEEIINIDQMTAEPEKPEPAPPAPEPPAQEPEAMPVEATEKASPFAGLPGLAEIDVTQTIDELKAEYRETFASVLLDYLSSSRPVTSYRNEIKRLANDGFTAAFVIGYDEGGGDVGSIPAEDIAWLNGRIDEEADFIADLFTELKDNRATMSADDASANAQWHADNYTRTIDTVYAEGLTRGASEADPELQLTGPDGQESCETCQGLKGEWHPLSWWREQDLLPVAGNANYICGCWKCQHYLEDHDGKQYTLPAG